MDSPQSGVGTPGGPSDQVSFRNEVAFRGCRVLRLKMLGIVLAAALERAGRRFAWSVPEVLMAHGASMVGVAYLLQDCDADDVHDGPRSAMLEWPPDRR